MDTAHDTHFRLLDLPNELIDLVYEKVLLAEGIHYSLYGQDFDLRIKPKPIFRTHPLHHVCRSTRRDFADKLDKLIDQSNVPWHFTISLPNDVGMYGGSNIRSLLPINRIHDVVFSINLHQKRTVGVWSDTVQLYSYDPMFFDDCGVVTLCHLLFKELRSIQIDFTNAPSWKSRQVRVWRDIEALSKRRNLMRVKTGDGWKETLDREPRSLSQVEMRVDGVVKVHRFRMMDGDWQTGTEVWLKTKRADGSYVEEMNEGGIWSCRGEGDWHE